jgi:hypothetical protein
MPSVPAPFTVTTPSYGTINTGDSINYKGQTYTITNVVGPTDNGLGVDLYTVTIVVAGSNVTFNCSANDTVVNNPGTEASATGKENWQRTGQSA